MKKPEIIELSQNEYKSTERKPREPFFAPGGFLILFAWLASFIASALAVRWWNGLL